MNNDQVAWTVCLDCGKRVTGDFIHTCSPQLKTLTDEEIHNLFLSFCNVGFMQVDEIGFARAILRKASEK